MNSTGVNITITFSPYLTGRSEAILRLTNEALEDPVEIEVSGTVLSAKVTFPVVVGLKSSYHQSESAVPLRLNIEGLNPQWTVDGKSVTEFNPASLSVGMHIVRFTTSTGVKGKVRVEIVD